MIITREDVERRGPPGHEGPENEDEDEWEDENKEEENEEAERARSPSPNPSEASTIKIVSPSVIAAARGQDVYYNPEGVRIWEDRFGYVPRTPRAFRGPSGDNIGTENEDPTEQEEEEETEEPPLYE